MKNETQETLISSAGAHDHASCTTIRNGKIIGFSETPGRGRAASGDIDESGRVLVDIVGVPPRGEAGTLEASCRLVDQLNRKFSQSWAVPTEILGVQHIDAQALGIETFSGRTLTIQIVRALTDPAFWKNLGYSGHISLSLSLRKAAEVLKAAVDLKVAKIPSPARSSLTLALDATDVPGLSLDSVIDEFNEIYGAWVDAQGFEAVWVIGPWGDMVRKLCFVSGEQASA